MNTQGEEDFSDVYTVEVYGLKGWEFANRTYHYRQAMDIFVSYVNAGIEVRITSPKENVLRKRLGLKEVS